MHSYVLHNLFVEYNSSQGPAMLLSGASSPTLLHALASDAYAYAVLWDDFTAVGRDTA